MVRAVAIAVLLAPLAARALPAQARGGDDRGEARVAGVCASGAVASLRLKDEDDGIEVRFAVERSRPGTWRVVVVHERRLAWRATVRTTRRDRSFELRRTLPDLPGSDTVTARAWGPAGSTCRATATVGQA
jgi:hypothetical protein